METKTEIIGPFAAPEYSYVVIDGYKVGDPMPNGYIQRQEWAKVHLKSGLKQEQCDSCCLWRFPHELSETRRVWYAETRDRHHRYTKVKMISRICKACELKQAPNTPVTHDPKGHCV